MASASLVLSHSLVCSGDLKGRTGTLCGGMYVYLQVGMIFVRCRGGVSHSPEEHVLDDDVWAAGLSVLAFLETHM